MCLQTELSTELYEAKNLVYYRNVSFRHLISLTHLCFTAFLSIYIALIDVLICSAAQLQECLIYLPTYLLTYLFIYLLT